MNPLKGVYRWGDVPRRYLPDSSGSVRVTERVWPRTYFCATCIRHGRAWILYARVPARIRACAYVAVLGLRDGHTAASVQTQLDGWATTATIAGYASTKRVPFACSAVAEDPNGITWLRLSFASRCKEDGKRGGGGEGDAYAGIEGT